MRTKTVKISDSNYKSVCEYAGELQQEFGEPVSIDKAIRFLLNRGKLSDLAGSWKMSDKEADDMLKTLRKGWRSWTIKSV